MPTIIPSFFKIRLALVIILVFILFFLIGLAHQAFAAWPGECQFVLEDPEQGLNICNSSGYSFSYPVTALTTVYTDGGWQTTIEHVAAMSQYQMIARLYYYESGAWKQKSYYAASTSGTGGPWRNSSSCSLDVGNVASGGTLPDSCEDLECYEEEQALKESCGEIGYTIDPETCEGSCNDPENYCEDQEEKDAASEQCGGSSYVVWEEKGTCNSIMQFFILD